MKMFHKLHIHPLNISYLNQWKIQQEWNGMQFCDLIELLFQNLFKYIFNFSTIFFFRSLKSWLYLITTAISKSFIHSFFLKIFIFIVFLSSSYIYHNWRITQCISVLKILKLCSPLFKTACKKFNIFLIPKKHPI